MSKDDTDVGCADISDSHADVMHIPVGSSIFTTDIKVVDQALDFI